jgi:hypothetical protein
LTTISNDDRFLIILKTVNRRVGQFFFSRDFSGAEKRKEKVGRTTSASY